MSKKFSLPLIGCLLFGIIGYFAWDSIGKVTFVSDFFDLYLHTAQRYLYIISIFMLPILYFTKAPFLDAVFRIRLKDKLFIFVLIKALKTAFYTSISIFSANILLAVFAGCRFDFSSYFITVFFTLFTFIFYCAILYDFIYFISGRQMLGLFCVFSSSLFLLAAIYGLNFFVFENAPHTDEKSMIIFYCYISAVIISALIGIGILSEKKECLK